MYLLLFCFISACVPLFTSAAEKRGADSLSLCVLPGYPEHGTYKVLNLEDGKPGQSFESVALNYTCQPPYGIVGRSSISCVSGVWSEPLPKCNLCGTIGPDVDASVVDGRKSIKLPWYAAIYTKSTRSYMQICGGTLISPSAVISAAHCFWETNKIQPKENYAVALGKTYRRWMSPLDDNAHKSDVKDLHISPQFTGPSTNYGSDIAVVVMADPVVYKVHIRPVCLSFETQFEKQQLQDGHSAKVGIWDYNITTQKLSKALKVVNVPYVDQPTCIARSPASFRPYITADKMCVGYENGMGPRRGDGGTGLAFPTLDSGVERYYLRGVVSTGPVSDDDGFVTATMLSHHEDFIKEFLDNENL